MKIKVSIILPSLNVAAYIRECLESVLAQTLKEIEVICVDAGSDDGTLGIIEEYEKKDDRLQILYSPRKSYGLQVNMGLDVAGGEYIGIVDTDDFVRPDMYETLYRYAKENDADFVKGDFDVFVHTDGGERIFMPYPVTWACSARYERCFSKSDFAESMQTPDVFLWNGVYKRKFLEDYHIRFNETPGAAIQDCGVRYKIALCVNRGLYINKSVYCYRRDNAGASSYSPKVIANHLGEFQSVIDFARARDDITATQWSFLAREIAIITFRTYQDLLVWGEAGEETAGILNDIRTLVKEVDKRNVISPEYMIPNVVLEANLFMDEGMCDGFARIRAKAVRDGLSFFLKTVSEREKVWIFGSKRVADYAYIFLKNNGVSNIAGFFDNDRKRQGDRKFGLPIVAPDEMIDGERDSYFLIASSGYIEDIKNWLLEHGVRGTNYQIYGGAFEQLLHPFICTNILLKEKL